MNALAGALLPSLILVGALLAAAHFYGRRIGWDLQSSYQRVLLIVGKWFGLVLAVLSGFTVLVDLLYWLGGGDIGGSAWLLIFGPVPVLAGIALWKFFGAWLRHDIKVGRI